MENFVQVEALSLLDEPVFSLAFGNRVEDFNFFWHLMKRGHSLEAEKLRNVAKKYREAFPVFSGISREDEEGKRHVMTIAHINSREAHVLRSFAAYFSSVLKETDKKGYGTPWFLLLYSLEGKSDAIAFLCGGSGTRTLNARFRGDGDYSFSVSYGLLLVDLTAPTLGENWNPLSCDLMETDADRIRVPELKEKLLGFRKSGDLQELLSALEDKNKAWDLEVRKRMEAMGFSKAEVEKMLEA